MKKNFGIILDQLVAEAERKQILTFVRPVARIIESLIPEADGGLKWTEDDNGIWTPTLIWIEALEVPGPFCTATFAHEFGHVMTMTSGMCVRNFRFYDRKSIILSEHLAWGWAKNYLHAKGVWDDVLDDFATRALKTYDPQICEIKAHLHG